MTDNTNAIADLRRELAKSAEALNAAEKYLRLYAEHNAALHLGDRVMYSPLHGKVAAAAFSAEQALKATDPESPTS